MRTPPLSVYDGQTHIGWLDDRGPGVVAYVIDAAGRRRKLGTYATRKEGVGAIAADDGRARRPQKSDAVP